MDNKAGTSIESVQQYTLENYGVRINQYMWLATTSRLFTELIQIFVTLLALIFHKNSYF